MRTIAVGKGTQRVIIPDIDHRPAYFNIAPEPKSVWVVYANQAHEPILRRGMQHKVNGFLLDRMHDWSWNNGRLKVFPCDPPFDICVEFV